MFGSLHVRILLLLELPNALYHYGADHAAFMGAQR